MSKPLAIIYFLPGHESVAKELAAGVRNEGNLANFVAAPHFKGLADCVKCEAILLQASYGKCKAIAATYAEHFPETEVHWWDDEGEFCDGPDMQSEKVAFKKPGESSEATEAQDPDTSIEETAAAVDGSDEDVADDPVLEEGDVPGDGVPVTQ